MEIVAVVNQKGGVGKTTTTINLATALAAVGKEVLVVDLDPQGNATTGFGISLKRGHGTYEVLMGDVRADFAVQKTAIPGLSVLPASPDLSGAEIELVPMENRELQLKKALKSLSHKYDYVLIDCPPSLGLLTLNAQVASNSLLVPLQCEYYALEGLSQLLNTLQRVKKNLNPQLELMGIILTMYDTRSTLSAQVAQDVRSHLGSRVFNTYIPRNVRVAEAPSFGKPVLLYDMKCVGSQAYIQLAKEILRRQGALLAA
ncbi:ParA family prote [Candidatus Bealeia paramacronuclearis]|uniref:ParA family prote n=1 Tax=Candidatus Bealeia paramacronuclearis TaxID=1921001 RepID=A0ABZ2C3R2_9PROT|nr:ParA family prote [Candidatus Bealeia paramacronuclearis]